MPLRASILSSLLAAGCAHVAPGSTEGVPPPWPAPDPAVARKAGEPPAEAAPAPAEGKPVVPPLKPPVPVPAPPPNTPQSAPATR